MIKREGICVVCKGKAIIAKRLPSGDLCFKHNQDRLWAKRQGKPKAPNIRTLRKPTGELIVFNRIYEASQGKCCITGDFLVFDIKNFAHVLSKAAYPSFRLLEENILHCRFEFHYLNLHRLR